MQLTEVNQAFDDKVRRGIFNPVARYVMNHPDAEDRVQDAVCQTWWMFRRYAVEKDTVLDDALLVNKARWVVTDLERRFVGKDGATCRNQDVHATTAYRDGRVELLRIDGFDDSTAEEDRSFGIGFAEAAAGNPERKMNSALDLEVWLGGLSHRDRTLMERKAAGFSTTQTASDLGLTYGVAYRREKQLGRELASRVGVRVEGGRKRAGRLE